MFQKQINLSNDLKRLRDEGFEIEVKGGYLIIHHIPYVNSNCEIKIGKLISTLELNNGVTLKPNTHVINFMGEYPCNNDGSAITAIQNSTLNQPLFDNIVLNYAFSCRPSNGYDDYFQKITQYVEIISSPAKSLDNTVTAKTFKVIEDNEEDSVFNYTDTNSSRANIYSFNSVFSSQKIAIIGLGGTGSYILDFVAKTPVAEIHLFDSDMFLQHNAFRAPGAPSIKTLNESFSKVDYFASIYSNMHKFIHPHSVKINEDNIDLLKKFTYVFICVDNNASRGIIMKKLKEFGVTFIDVGMGVNIAENNLIGTLRMTAGTPMKNDHIENRVGTGENLNNEYASNIQIADLNALNGLMAVVKWKKLSGFYQDLKSEHNSTYSINTSQLLNDDIAAQVC